MKMHAIFVALAVVATAGLAQAAKDDAMDVGGFELRLGTEQKNVLERLGSVYRLKAFEAVPGTWGVSEKNGPPDNFIAAIAFQGDVLTSVSKNWDYQASSPRSLAIAIAHAMRSVDGRTCSVTSKELQGLTAIVLNCGGRRIDILASLDDKSSPSVSESIQK